MGHTFGAGIAILGILGTLLFWGGALLLLVWAVRSFNNRPLPQPVARPTPRDILDERLARGETTVADYEKARAALGKPD